MSLVCGGFGLIGTAITKDSRVDTIVEASSTKVRISTNPVVVDGLVSSEDE